MNVEFKNKKLYIDKAQNGTHYIELKEIDYHIFENIKTFECETEKFIHTITLGKSGQEFSDIGDNMQRVNLRKRFYIDSMQRRKKGS